ncbi:DUF3883 domain-containing protein [Sedimenticola selenatireducens]|uniref:DUF3883 domain-containing protein n=1 Tax=Sedimenticola selenatireducens TaxID=191960 RepID=UPI0004B9CD2C|nr:DUF3883 domain-containing protein [Sedimenticola selenatireducens]
MIWLTEYERQFTRLRMNQSGGHASPHKLCMLLAVLDLFEGNAITRNRIHFDESLREYFRRHFNHYRGPKDRENPHLPFFHLRSEDFWHHRIRDRQEASYQRMTTTWGPGQIEKHIAYAYLDEPLYELLLHQITRDRLREVLIVEGTRLNGILGQELEVGDNTWGWIECELAVHSYLEMLDYELQGETYRKTDFRNRLLEQLPKRSKGSVEYKHQNISAILIDLGYPYIAGYKPAFNYQRILREVVEVHLAHRHGLLVQQAEASLGEAIVPRPTAQWGRVQESPPAPYDTRSDKTDTKREFIPKKYNFSEREASNRQLGLAGEKFVLEFERFRMKMAGREDLVSEIEWTSQEQGDGAGYDIRSFRPESEEELFIEVKTTNGGKYQPFLISENEVEFSKARAEDFALYRVFEFRKMPRLFVLEGNLGAQVNLSPQLYKAWW